MPEKMIKAELVREVVDHLLKSIDEQSEYFKEQCRDLPENPEPSDVFDLARNLEALSVIENFKGTVDTMFSRLLEGYVVEK